MIPRILHRIWLWPPGPPMPETFIGYGDEWRRLHPEWEVKDWTSFDDLPQLRNQDMFNRAHQMFPKDVYRFQADLLRLELLWLYGGVYADTDVEPLKPFDPLLEGRTAFAAWSPNLYHGRQVVTQAVIASTPGHEWIDACIAGAGDAVTRYRGRPLAQVVGPHHVDRCYRAHGARVTVFPSGVFYPQSVRDRDKGLKANLDGAYATHHWNTSLRKQGKGLG